MTSYHDFLERKSQSGSMDGFQPNWMPDFLFDFQTALVDWAIRKGRAALFCDCGMGKSPMQLVWAQNIVRHTNKRVLILTPLAVSPQTLREGEKFGIECERSTDGKGKSKILVTNYERLHHFDPNQFIACIADESSVLKSFSGIRRRQITEFMRRLPYRLLCTATAAPNDYTELGTSSEALGELGHIDMLGRFFKNMQNTIDLRRHVARRFMKPGDFQGQKWRFKGHAELPFWRWVCSWARSIRKPSDLGFDDDGFILPPLTETEHIIKARQLAEGHLFALPAVGLREQREERRRTIEERCEKVAALVANTGRPALVWCQLNAEGDLLGKLISDGVQVSGSDTDDAKEEKFLSFIDGSTRVLITKAKIAGWGLNLQHCSHVVYFPSHSYEAYYQGIRRCWRFGQKNPVQVDIVATEGDHEVMESLKRKAKAADVMFSRLVEEMNHAMRIDRKHFDPQPVTIPQWI